MNSLCPLLNREIPVQSHNIDQHPMKLFAEFSGDLNKVKKPLWTIYLKKLNTEIFFFYQRRKWYLVPGVSLLGKLEGCVCVCGVGGGGGRGGGCHNHLDT